MCRALLLAAGLLLALSFASADYSGDGTAYSGPGDKDATGFNACGFGRLDSQWERMYGAMNAAQFGGSCGKCVRVRGTDSGASGKSFLVMIVDKCPECKFGDIDFSTTALEAITGFSWDRKSISWEYADCNGPTDARSNTDGGDSSNDSNQDNSDTSDKKDKKDEEPPSPPPPSGQPTGTYKDWVVDCTGDHERCPNLALASQGYQCTNLKGTKCCLTSSGDGCVDIDSVKDKDVEWDGERPKTEDPPSPPPPAQEEQQPEDPPSPPPPAEEEPQPEEQQPKPEEQQPQPEEQQPKAAAGAEVADQLAATVTDAFAAAAAAVAGAAGGNRKLLLR